MSGSLDMWLSVAILLATILPFLYTLHRQNLNRLLEHTVQAHKSYLQLIALKKRVKRIERYVGKNKVLR